MSELYFKYEENISLTCFVLAQIEYIGDIFKDDWGGVHGTYKGYYTFAIGKFNDKNRTNLYYQTREEAELKHKELRDLLTAYHKDKNG